MIRQTIAITLMSLKSLGSRLSSGAVVIFGIGGVVAVLMGLLAMSAGFRSALVDTAEPDRALVLRGSSNNEMDGWLTVDEFSILRTYEGLSVVSGEVYVTINALKRDSDTAADIVGRGVSEAAFTLRPEVSIVAGRHFQPGRDEVIVGVKAAGQYQGLEIGDRVAVRGGEWTVVGLFSAGGTAVESEVWVDLPVAQSVFRRTFSVARVRADPGEMDRLAAAISEDPRLDLTLIPEGLFYSAQSSARSALIETFAYLLAGIMAVGAVVAALNTMYTVVSQRGKEIATLRALGFGSVSVFVAVLAEALLLAILGGVSACALVYLGFDGYVAATQNQEAGNQLVFAFAVTPHILLLGTGGAVLLGLIGGSLPALKAARAPISVALRGD